MNDIASQRALKDAKQTLLTLEEAGFKAMLAGGCVRDRLLNIPPKDYDIATTARPAQVSALFEQKNVKIIPTGIEHGTVTVLMPSGPIEVTTLRQDVATDGRRATVAFSDDFKEDALRRDFTINSLFEDREGGIHDYFGGQQDLKAGVLRFVGDAHKRIKEDYLRILRLYRFWSRFGFQPTQQSLDACAELCVGIKQLSQERITGELLQIFEGRYADLALENMAKCNVWQECIPIDPTKIALKAIVGVETPHHQGLARFISCFLQAPPVELANILKGLRLDGHSVAAIKSALLYLPNMPLVSANHAQRMEWIDQLESYEFKWQDFFAPIALNTPHPHIDQQNARTLLTFEERFGAKRRAPLPINGRDLHQEGYPPGPQLGELLSELKAAFRNGEWSTKEEGLRWAKSHIRKV